MAKSALFLILAAFAPLASAQRPAASLECRHAGKDFVYDCAIRVSRNGEPLPGLSITVSADMPSMPMAHQVKPVKAKASDRAGEYRARLELEMPGEWAVKLRLSGSVRDLIVLHYEFDERGARPAIRTGTPRRK